MVRFYRHNSICKSLLFEHFLFIGFCFLFLSNSALNAAACHTERCSESMTVPPHDALCVTAMICFRLPSFDYVMCDQLLWETTDPGVTIK